MLLEFLVAGCALILIMLLVTLEVAALSSRRTYIPESSIGRVSAGATPDNIAVSDYLFCSRLATACLLLLIGFLVAHLWEAPAVSIRSFLNEFIPTGFISQSDLLVTYVTDLLLAGVTLAIIVLFVAILPFQIAHRFSDKALVSLAPFGFLLVRVLSPLLSLRCKLNKIKRIPSNSAVIEEEAIEDDIRSLVEEGERAGFIEEEESKIISRVFKLGDKPLASLMTPRSDVVFLNSSMSGEDALKVVLEERYTWYPVLNGDLETVLGVVSAHDVYELTQQRLNNGQGAANFGLKGIVTTAIDVPESMTALDLLELFKEQGGRFAVVRDEYGSIAGIATVDDVLKLIVGELAESSDEERSIIPRDDGSYIVDASSDVQNLFELLGCVQKSYGEQAPFHSVGGFVMTSLGQIPKEGDYFNYENYRFEVVDMDGKRIDKVLVIKIEAKTAVGG